MRCLVFALAMIVVSCSTHNQLGPRDSRVSSALSEPETTVIWLDNPGRFPSVGYFDVQTFYNETDLGPGSYVRVASLHATGMSQHALLGKLRLKASQVGANRLLIVKVEVKKEEVYLYSGLENVARFFSGEKTDADRKDEAYTLRIDAIAIRRLDDLSTVYRYRPGDDRPTVYQPRRTERWPTTVSPPRRRDDRRSVYRPPRRDDRPAARPPRRKDDRQPVKPPPPREDRPTVKPPLPRDEPPIERPPPPRDVPSTEKPPLPEEDQPTAKPPPPPPEEDRSTLKRPRMKTHRP